MKKIISNILPIVMAFLLGAGITHITCGARIIGDSMSPTLKNGQWTFGTLLVKPYNYGDIVTTKPIDMSRYGYEKDIRITKRIIGVEGDIIWFEDGILYRNGEKVDESYAQLDNYTSSEKITVPKGELFLAGDNRQVSLDSRDIGCVKEEDINSKVLIHIG